jgi:ABC-type transport system involved in cytochrome bd biosynthesis fused ATPase/permease subunit
MLTDKQSSDADLTQKISEINVLIEQLQQEFDANPLPEKPVTYYKNVSEAYEHKSSIQQIEKQIELKIAETDQYEEQIINLKKSGIKTITWDKLNELSNVREHQKFLLKLLTNKDSFIRKKIIEQNLVYLNTRLEHYLDKLGLPHSVMFQSDLSVSITNLGRDLDFDNLSRGERNRLILGLSWAFRDVFESMNDSINFLAIDELVDSGLDTAGVEASLELLNQMSRERNKSIMLISHREELIGRVNKILMVTKESGFTSYSYED